jgi:hypothetical protein
VVWCRTGEFFLIQDERAAIGGEPFDTLSED